jgi:hypothetical protein
MGWAQPDILHDGCEAVRVVRQVKLRWQIRGAPSAWFIPGNDRELVGQSGELRLPDTPVVPGAVHEYERRPFADALVSDLETACPDNLHEFTLSSILRPFRVTVSTHRSSVRPDETPELDADHRRRALRPRPPYRPGNAAVRVLTGAREQQQPRVDRAGFLSLDEDAEASPTRASQPAVALEIVSGPHKSRHPHQAPTSSLASLLRSAQKRRRASNGETAPTIM